jgi:DNA-binding MarR family transcriptional regulator
MSATEEVRQSIETRLRAIEAEVHSLTDALKRLDASGPAPTPGGNGRTGPKPPRVRQARQARLDSHRALTPVTSEAIQQLLSGGNGVSAGELAGALNAARAQVLARLKKLEAQGSVRRTGERRATRWHAITDEDRIRERAAELEQRRAAAGRR